MKPIPLTDLARLLHGTLITPSPQHLNTVVSGFATDSNDVKSGDAFLAIKGARVDGHHFVPQAIEKGAAVAVVEHPVERPHILVDDLVDSLARFAYSYRFGFHGPVIGITGSAGKTTAKEFTAAALSPLGPVLKTEGNRNTEYTAPLMWAELTTEHKAVVVEMAMRGFGQIRHLATFSQPTTGVITNIGYSHLEMVGSREGIARAKSELLDSLPNDGLAVLWAEDEYLRVLEAGHPVKVVTFGYSERADCRITSYRSLSWTASEVEGMLDGRIWRTRLPAVGKHLALSAALAVLVAVRAGVEAQEAADALSGVKLPPMRMEVMEVNGATILLDTYNASPPSMIAAIETLAELTPKGHRKAVLGEMRELGAYTEEAHRTVGRTLAEHGIDEVLFVGEPMRFAEAAARERGLLRTGFARELEDVRSFLSSAAVGDGVLIKGSRALELEKALPQVNRL